MTATPPLCGTDIWGWSAPPPYQREQYSDPRDVHFRQAKSFKSGGGKEEIEWVDSQGRRFKQEREYRNSNIWEERGDDIFTWVYPPDGGYHLATTKNLPCSRDTYLPETYKYSESLSWGRSRADCFPGVRFWHPERHPRQLYQGDDARFVARRFAKVGTRIADYFASRLMEKKTGEAAFALDSDVVEHHVGRGWTDASGMVFSVSRYLSYRSSSGEEVLITDQRNNRSVDNIRAGGEYVFENYGRQTKLKRRLLDKFTGLLRHQPHETHYAFYGKPTRVHVAQGQEVKKGEALFVVEVDGELKTIRAALPGRVRSIWQTSSDFRLELNHPIPASS